MIFSLRFKQKEDKSKRTEKVKVGWFMVFSATFNIISAISWRSVLLVEETGAQRENHRHVTKNEVLFANLLTRA
jgi:hypothetical protein